MNTNGWKHFSFERARARIAGHRAEMRAYAMEFREDIAPNGTDFGTFAKRCEHAAKQVEHAVFYRDLAASVSARLAERIKEAA